MDHGAVVTTAKLFADLDQRQLRERAREIHGHLTAFSDVFRTTRAGEVAHTKIVVRGDDALHFIDGDLT